MSRQWLGSAPLLNNGSFLLILGGRKNPSLPFVTSTTSVSAGAAEDSEWVPTNGFSNISPSSFEWRGLFSALEEVVWICDSFNDTVSSSD